MSTNKKKEYFNIKTPRGVAVYPKLDKPRKWDDTAQRSVEALDGKYEVSVALSSEVAEPLKASILNFAKAQGLKRESDLKNVPWKAEVDKATDEETGRVLFKFTNYGTNRDGSLKRIPQFDAAAKPLAKSFRLTSGSEVKIAGTADYYVKGANKGIRLLVDGVQVLKFVEQEMRNPFEAEEGFTGPTADEDDDNSSFDNETSESGEGNAADF